MKSKYKFNSKYAAINCVSWIKGWFEKNGPNCNAIVGISGGKDSTVVAELCARALGKERVIGVLMPNVSADMRLKAAGAIAEMMSKRESIGLRKSAENYFNDFEKYASAMHALNDGYRVCKYLGIKHFVININNTVNALLDEVSMHVSSVSNQTKINIAPRLRMTTLYAIAQSNNGRVANTSNLSERYIGYGTRWGDTVGDFAPLAELTCSEVKELGRQLHIPEAFVNRTPDDGLCGKSDEENFGFTYAQLDEFIRTGKVDGISADEHVDNYSEVDYNNYRNAIKVIDQIKERANVNKFKLKPIASFDSSEFISA